MILLQGPCALSWEQQTRPSLRGCLRVPGFCGARVASFYLELGGCDINCRQGRRRLQAPNLQGFESGCGSVRPVTLQRELLSEWLLGETIGCMHQCPVEFLGLGLDEGRRGTQRTCCRTSLLRKLHLGHGPGALPSQIEAVIDSVVAMYKALDRGMKLLGSSGSRGPGYAVRDDT